MRGLMVGAGVVLLLTLAALPQASAQVTASTTIYIIPVYEWSLVWEEWRNDNYIYGSIWRPKMIEEYTGMANFPGVKNIEVDGYDVSQYFSDKAEPVFLGDVFQKGNKAPNFVGSVLVLDEEPITNCPPGVPCFQRESTARFQNLLIVTPDRNLFESVWESFIRQCKEQTAIDVPLLCTGSVQAAGNCEAESGYASGEVPIRILRPTCPSDFYVMGHVALKGTNGTIPNDEPMTSYKCIHESLLRKGTFLTDPLFTSSQSGTSVYNQKLVVSEYFQPISLWGADCTQEGCTQDHCIDTVGEGLFYGNNIETSSNLQITGPSATAPNTGPKCLALYRDCTKLQADGSFITNTFETPPAGLLESECDAELGMEGDPLASLQGLYLVTPSGLPTIYESPLELELVVVDRICAQITESNPVNLEGDVRINGVLTTWVSMSRQSSTRCVIKVNVVLDGTIKPGPCRIVIKTITGTGALLEITSEGGTDNRQQKIGYSYGRLTMYNDPSVNATLIEPKVINSFFCQLRTIVKFPPETLVRPYAPGLGSFLCEWRNVDDPDTWYVGEEPSVVDSTAEGYRGIKCFIPQRTAPSIVLKVTMNAGLSWHTIEQRLVRLGDPDSAIASEGALRVFDVVPRAGPETGGTLVTVNGKYFENYCNQTAINMGAEGEYCNKMTCTFIFSIGGGSTQKSVAATVVDDKRLTCITPQAVSQVSLAQLEISADFNPPCSTVADDPLKYNQVDFLYQASGTAAEIPTTCCNFDPAVGPHRLQGEWNKCLNTGSNATGYADCRGFPGLWDNVADLGYISCLGGFTKMDSNESTSPNYPVWCFRALPMNSGADYQITFTDPFFQSVAFLLRKIPISYPGYCHVTNHHLTWERISTQLDYRVYDVYDRGYRPGEPIPDSSKRTQGKDFIDRLFSTTALSSSNGVSYMRDVLHTIGHKYGFIDLGLSFNLEIDFTLASGYDEVNYRRATPCARPNPKHGFYSGFVGDEGPGGSFVDWNAQFWQKGKPACAPNDLWSDRCERTILKSPNHDDDIGVMLTAPAEVELTAEAEDFVLGCGRLRVIFNCSSFSIDDCVRHEILRDTPEAQYRNFGSKTNFLTWDNWCAFNYPEEGGPNNAQAGWTGTTPPSGYEDYRYWYRKAPCIRCRQAKEICDALFINSTRLPVVDNVPTGTHPVDLGDKSSTFEIPLGCFGDPKFGGGVEDQCCLDTGDQSTTRPFLGKCTTTLQRCVRAGKDFRCARMNEGDANDEDCTYNSATLEAPLCAPLNLV